MEKKQEIESTTKNDVKIFDIKVDTDKKLNNALWNLMKSEQLKSLKKLQININFTGKEFSESVLNDLIYNLAQKEELMDNFRKNGLY